ncbi:MAG TPA: EAL domain-containing protein [Acetobacteraceae bacterium]|jgi:diguanylate cyclase (GGDEF)-like protein|nr:EAL domain-containing protein [Acetobacteraceae bacterium]
MPNGPRIGAIAFTLAVVAMGSAGLWYMTQLVTRLEENAIVEHALRNHLEADMMHDALRGDVLAAQYQTHDHHTLTDGLGVPPPAFAHSFADHVTRFRKAIGENKVPDAAEYSELAVVLASVGGPLSAYITEAEWLVPLAFSDPGLATEMLPVFDDHYNMLETSMEAASDRIEVIAGKARLAVAVARTKATLLIGTAALLTMFATFRRWRQLKREVATRRAVEAKLRALAVHDDLTGLPNRRGMAERLNAALARSRRDGSTIAVLLVDLDRFKPVNDLRGHAAGDRLLQLVAKRMTDTLREADIVARVGGDEFVVAAQFGPGTLGAYADGTTDMIDATARMARRLVAVLEEPFDLGDAGIPVLVGASVGVALAPDGEVDVEDLLRRADMAMYLAKEKGRGCFRFFEPEMDAAIRDRAALEAALRQAIVADELMPYFQPFVALGADKRPIGFEMLARWSHPERGFVPPADFIPLAEETGLIVRMTEQLLRRACNAAASWPDHLILAVNVSPVQLRDRALPAMVAAALAESGLPARRLEIELTESALVGNFELARELLTELKELGVHLTLDDFGTGHSSLRHLQMLPFDKIKVDASFVRNMHISPESGKIVAAVVALGRSLGLLTVAEGIEDAVIATALRDMGCHIGQGWLFGQPLAEHETAALAYGEMAALLSDSHTLH